MESEQRRSVCGISAIGQFGIVCDCGWMHQKSASASLDILIKEYLKHNPNSDIIAKKPDMTVDALERIFQGYFGHTKVKVILPDIDGPFTISKVEYKEPINGLPGFVAIVCS